MRHPSLRSASLGFFGLLSGVLVVAWGFSIFGSYGVIWEPHAKAEIAGMLIRGRLVIEYADGGTIDGRPGFRGDWLGAPRNMTDVLGVFRYERFEDPWLPVSGGSVTSISIPIPFLVAVAATIAYVIYRRFGLTLAAWLSLLAIASILLAAYAHPYREEHYPSIPELDESFP